MRHHCTGAVWKSDASYSAYNSACKVWGVLVSMLVLE